MITRRHVLFAVLATSLLTMFLITIVPSRSQNAGEYDPWLDWNDDGKINLIDVFRTELAFGTSGTAINKTALLLGLQSRMDDVNASLTDLQSRVGDLEQFGGSVYRWNVFDTCDASGALWLSGNDPSLYGGVAPSLWTYGAATADQISSDKEVLRTLFCQKGYGGTNALVYSNVFMQYDSGNGRVVVCLFRIRNTMSYFISWNPYFRYSCYYGMGFFERASVALNGALAWTSGSGQAYGDQAANVVLPIPPNRTSTVIFVSTSSRASAPATPGLCFRTCVLAFCNNSLALPTGLKYLDDLDTATGGWEQ